MQQNNKYKLELAWIGKNDERQPLEPRILIENKEYLYGEPETGVLPNGKPWKGNMLIHCIYMVETKALKDIPTEDVQAKKKAAEEYCKNASEYTAEHGGKPWKYHLLRHDIVERASSFEYLMALS